MTEALSIGPLTLTWWSVIMLGSLLASAACAWILAYRQRLDTGLIYPLTLWAPIGGLVGARLLYVLNPPPSVAAYYSTRWFLSHLFDLQAGPLAVWNGGLDPAGSLLGGTLALLVVLYHARAPLAAWLDVLAIALLVGYILAPWANVVERQLLGPPTSLPWGLPVDHTAIPFPPGTRLHPTPAYISLWSLLALGLVLLAERQGWLAHPGDRALLSSSLLAAGLFGVGFLRLDVNVLLLFTPLQIVALGALIAAGVTLARRLQHGSNTPLKRIIRWR